MLAEENSQNFRSREQYFPFRKMSGGVCPAGKATLGRANILCYKV